MATRAAVLDSPDRRRGAPSPAARRPPARPQLEVVPGRRRIAGLAVVLGVFVSSLLLGVTAFQTSLAERQLRLDELEGRVAEARANYDRLREQRAVLRSPERLALEAAGLGLVPGHGTEFISVPPDVVAEVAASASDIDPDVGSSVDPLEQFSEVKDVVGAAP